MIARLLSKGKPVAEMGDDWNWSAMASGYDIELQVLNEMFSPNNPLSVESGDSAVGVGRACAGRAAKYFRFDIEFGSNEPLPEGAQS